MTHKKENPQPLARQMGGLSNNKLNIYTPSQQIAQGVLARRYGISRAYANIVAFHLHMGGA
jgi:hypothetical protein